MAAKRRKIKKKTAQKTTTQSRGKTGPTGPAGPAGPPGVPGTPGHDHASELALMRAQIDQLVRELQTQLTRIGQLQAQLDHFTTGQASQPKNRPTPDGPES